MKTTSYLFTSFILLFFGVACNDQDLSIHKETSSRQQPPAIKHQSLSVEPEDSLQHDIGEFFGGGVIYYLDHSGRHGLIVSLKDLSERMSWGPEEEVPLCKSTTDGAGNTRKIIAICKNVPCAARLCWQYEENGFSDWYLPASDELKTLSFVREKINSALKEREDTEPVSTSVYWSSTEFNRFVAWGFHFKADSGYREPDGKYAAYKVRAVRKF